MTDPAPKASLRDKLKALGVKVGALDLPAPQRKPNPAGDGLAGLDGRFVPTARGEVFVHEETYGADYRHGRAPLASDVPLDLLSAWAREPRLPDMPLESFAFLDTETSGMAGGTGTYAFLVGVGRFETGASGRTFRLLQFFMRDPGEEAALLEALAGFLAPCAALVTYNGKAFDAPLLRARYTLHDIPCPFSDFAHVDLLPLARRLWRDRLPSRTLKYIEEHVLGAPRSSQEVPGYEIPWLYFDYLRSGEAAPLAGVFYHNAMDVVALAAMFGLTASMLHDPFDGRIQHGLDVIALAKLNEDLGGWDTAARLYERGLEMTLGQEDFWEAVRRLSVLQKRRGDLEQAVGWWEQAAAQGHIYAHVELAKFHEHRRRDIPAARRWAQSALDLAAAGDLPPYARAHWQAELEHRLARLEARSKKPPARREKRV
ncbi:MAG: ribonuclease H-like domain-containing protein [Chloroflexota bacterium]